MSSAHIAQLVAALIAAVTPWIVVRIAFAVAAGQARSAQMSISRPRVMTALGWLTIVAAAVVCIVAALLPAPSIWMGVFDLALFAVLAAVGLKALGAIDEISRPAREASASVREASLRPRRLNDYVSVTWHGLLLLGQGAALAVFAWRLLMPVPDRRPWVPVMFALAAPVFTWLYEVWMRDLVSGGHVAGGDVESIRRRRIRLVFAAEAALAIVCLAVGHALLNLNWDQQTGWGTGLSLAGAVVGIAGCALAVASDLARRRYETA
jgi:UDP-N-acetylmuramyl pentapeptide phosphotransferase/UDP-N-acetylglucosamine-1-phosphate transferase